VNDSEEEIERIRDFVKMFPNTSYELLKFHRLGEVKYEALGRKWEIKAKELDEDKWEKLQKIIDKENF
jgi:pyruvate formate lyase activating enzyme